MKKRKTKEVETVEPVETPKRRERSLDQLTPLDLEHFRVTQPTENDVEEELDILRNQGYTLGDE